MSTLSRLVLAFQSLSLTASLAALVGAGCGTSAPETRVKTPSFEPKRTMIDTQPRPTSTSQAVESTAVRISDEILRACGIPADKAYFAFDSSRLTGNDEDVLRRLADCFVGGAMKRESMRLIGRADPRGATEYNLVLGHSRADAVASYLESKHLEASRIVVTSRGAMDATGIDESGWSADRRVDVLVAH